MKSSDKRVAAALFVYPEGQMGTARVEAGAHVLSFFCFGKHTVWRYKTLYVKEPETIAWLDRIGEGEVLWDVGANVGIYSVYAAMTRKAKVLAFEPSASNYYVLNMNIELNKAANDIAAYCLAFADETACGVLNMSSSAPGAAGSSFNETVDDHGNVFVPSFTQGMLGYTIDGFIETFAPAFPNHLKVDVDGLEDKIVKGASRTLADARLKSLSIELDSARPDYVEGVIGAIQAAGMTFLGKHRSKVVAPDSSINNYQFQRA